MNKTNTKTTLVIGASENLSRYSNMAIKLLKAYGHPVLALGKSKGNVDGSTIETDINSFKHSEIDTITIYLNPDNQEKYYESIIDLHPKRVIFNPGTENEVLQEKLEKAGIEFEEACTLVLLKSQQF